MDPRIEMLPCASVSMPHTLLQFPAHPGHVDLLDPVHRTTPAVRAVRSTYRQTVSRWSSPWTGKALETVLVQVPTADRPVGHVPAQGVSVGQPAHEAGAAESILAAALFQSVCRYVQASGPLSIT